MINIQQNFSSAASITVSDFPVTGMGEITPVNASASTGEITPDVFYDSIINTQVASSTWRNWQCAAFSGAAITNSNPELATLGTDGLLIRVSSGIGSVVFSKDGIETRRQYDTALTGGSVSIAHTGYTPGTVAAALFDSVAAYANSDMNKRQMPLFSAVNHGAETYTKNPNCWARNIDLSCLSVATKSPSGAWTHERPGVLITPRHVRCANHHRPLLGDLVRFLTPAGVVRNVTVTGISTLVEPDLVVLTLSEDVVGCSIARVAAPWMVQNVGDVYDVYAGGMLIVTDKFRNIGICAFGNTQGLCEWRSPVGLTFPRHLGAHLPGLSSLRIFWSYDEPSFVPYQDIALGIGGGSSGSPWFAIAGDQLVVMVQALVSNGGLGSWISGPGGVGNIHDTLIAEADASAGISTGLTVTVATDPTI